ncbi:hypothetical protein KP79_PYT21083 [Mizuhopecten yessoensis]|uniref:Uncharacterized protein n=1 Tax=Mizuhopecten yessoensis TaxID=6573 RepID=A0A210Q5W8_MIZYE|nr:hypothetical protein KP79_PYT21083 [Mizuhopecten yessoensis]
MEVDFYGEIATFLQSDPTKRQWPKRVLNAEAVTKNVPPRLMRQCHVHTYRQHALQRLISSSTTLEKAHLVQIIFLPTAPGQPTVESPYHSLPISSQ